jgi:Cys-tRNA(Pro)/Cys-tRNA(Cys) deacylase
MKTKVEKTNPMRVLDALKLDYEHFTYDNMTLSSEELAEKVGVDPDGMFKTLVCVGKSGQNYVFMVPTVGELDLKKAAQVTGEKSIEMIPQKTLLPLTGYVHGGCSPIGMKKLFPTFIDEVAMAKTVIAFSGGKVAHQIKTKPANLLAAMKITVADIAK